jgi:transposase-like protein
LQSSAADSLAVGCAAGRVGGAGPRWSFTAEVILWAVRWYLMFPISYRDLELMLADRGVDVDHTTVFRWIQAYAPELEKRIRPHLRRSDGSWRVDETYVRVKGRWMYLYRAVDSRGATIDFLLSATRDAAAAKMV